MEKTKVGGSRFGKVGLTFGEDLGIPSKREELQPLLRDEFPVVRMRGQPHAVPIREQLLPNCNERLHVAPRADDQYRDCEGGDDVAAFGVVGERQAGRGVDG